ncbi:DUF559 domain-containing protein [Solirubrobacter ginsenosidimutans]|uniref:DUF559 domain-containing protein n=1 Tax=Solirubrobacter ginsenosidimutans TaxID=490573 RepID=A0A9X3S0Y2_9ACTN|nr:type IV toxin-antitoxin system AbiEi family antitoxin domain-containing protein [Solirubrobacter ginsenosidimutans]MDA0159631.1 DUF559 domain-containing protein [Solirubrobacter ginsenosidimutans]
MPSQSFLTGNIPEAPPVDIALAALAERQHGLATLGQLTAAGLTRPAITKRVARGVLHRVHRGVYAIGHCVLSREAEWLAAVLAVGDGAVLSHHSGAELNRLTYTRGALVDVTVPHHRRSQPGIRVHCVRRLDPRDVTHEHGIPVTTVHRTFVDLSDLLTPHELVALFREANFHGHYVELAIRDSMARANGRHNLKVLDRAMERYAYGSAGTRSRGEVLFLRLDLPEPLVNTKLFGHEVDFLWPEVKLNVEIDGPQHYTPAGRRADAARDRILASAGYTVLRFPEEAVKERPDEVLRAVSAWVSSRGSRRAA